MFLNPYDHLLRSHARHEKARHRNVFQPFGHTSHRGRAHVTSAPVTGYYIDAASTVTVNGLVSISAKWFWGSITGRAGPSTLPATGPARKRLHLVGASNGQNQRFHAAAVPTSGAYLKADIAWNLNAAASGKVGWVCVTSGSPGAWKAFGPIDA